MADLGTRVLLAVSGGALLLGVGAVPAVAAVPAGAAVASVNDVHHGSFEMPALTAPVVIYGAGSQGISGWRVGRGSVERVGAAEWRAYSGAVSVALAGHGPGDLYQFISTTAGSTYSLTYALGGNFHCGQSVKTVRVTADHLVVDRESFNDAGSSRAAMHWVLHTVQFTAASAMTRLDFADVTPDRSACGAVIDAVRLSESPPAVLPEAPSVGLLGLLGVGLAGGGYTLARRRGRRRSATV